MSKEQFANELNEVLKHYQKAFADKVIESPETAQDILMDIFGITFFDKIKNMQYWGRELGLCWQRLIVAVFKNNCNGYKPALKIGKDEPCDVIVDSFAIDTKYRVGSGDSGTLKKFKQYGPLLKENKLKPVMLFLREDNLPAAMTALKSGDGRFILVNLLLIL